MDEIYERLNPRIPIEYVLFSFLALSIVIVLGMLMMKWGRVKKFLLGSLLTEYYFLVLCSTVICRGCGSERRKELVPFWNYADIWNRIKELKNDFSIDDFVTNNFWATEACGNFIVMAYNFMSLFRHALINSNKKKFLKTIRYELISTPAYLGKTKDKHILYLARSLKTRQSFLSIWEKLKDFSLPYDTEKS